MDISAVQIERAFARWLVDGGVLLLTAGAQAWTRSELGWLGAETEMWWSHADTATYRSWLKDAGFRIVPKQYMPEGHSGHSLFRSLARRYTD